MVSTCTEPSHLVHCKGVNIGGHVVVDIDSPWLQLRVEPLHPTCLCSDAHHPYTRAVANGEDTTGSLLSVGEYDPQFTNASETSNYHVTPSSSSRSSWTLVMSSMGSPSHSLSIGPTSEDSTRNLVQEIRQKDAHVDLLVNNPGISSATAKVEKGDEKGQP
ncbi:hypothetical protein PAXINDRAFT_13892 [Paxillus involutus ATCC 200175]|uniref:Uncharacterized protein n=1 Tax=Paxillus involutus ATCC 200175 TaxID=664439 RepID=A0A0C9U1J7_PAXIN|nr:hypothetical protein PAXINDRAFT_13892 [Paxillus involutus ATCC 200175]